MQHSIPLLIVFLNLLVTISLFRFKETQEVIRNKRKILQIINFSFLLSSLLYATFFINKPYEIHFIKNGTFDFSFSFNSLHIVFCLIALIIQFVVLRFSLNYLKTDVNQPRFLNNICLAGIGLQGLFLSTNILSTWLFLLLISFASNRLVGFFRNRNKSFRVSKRYNILNFSSNALIFISFALFAILTHSGEFETIQQALIAQPSFLGSIGILLLLIGSFMKAAQFPFHNWLTEVMEAPTPVSALLHAGIIGVGPFLLFSFSTLIYSSTSAILLIVCLSLISILIGAPSFSKQSGIKNLLAYSSIAHLGFTLLLFGLGLPAASLLHFSAHAFYKAHAFLSSGSELERKNSKNYFIPQVSHKYLGLVFLILTPIAFWVLFHTTQLVKLFPTSDSLLLLIGIAIGTLFSNAITQTEKIKFHLDIYILGIGTFFIFLFLESIFTTISTHIPTGIFFESLRIVSLIGISLLIVLNQLIRLSVLPPLFPSLNIHLQHGFYIPIIINRIYSNFLTQEK